MELVGACVKNAEKKDMLMLRNPSGQRGKKKGGGGSGGGALLSSEQAK